MLNIQPRTTKQILGAENVAELYSSSELQSITTHLMEGYQNDEKTMEPYIRRANSAVKLARMDSGGKDKTFPFAGAANILGPYLMEAAIEFNARVMPDFDKTNLTKAEVIGDDSDGAKEKRGERVKTVVDYVINHELDGCAQGCWRSDTDRALLYWPVVGMFFRKNWQCPQTDKQKSALIFGTEMIYDHSCESFYQAPRQSHCFRLSKNASISRMRTGQFVPLNLPEETIGTTGDGRYDGTTPPQSNEGYEYIEMHCSLDLDGDDYAEPYIVTILKDEEQVAAIVPRYDEEDIEKNSSGEIYSIESEDFFTQYGFIPDISPEAKAVFVGWGILLHDILETINTATNQMIDAGTLQNTSANSGFIDSTARTKKGRVELIMGQFTQIQTGTTARPLRDSIAQFPFAGPSQSLFSLLEALKLEVRKMVSASYNLEGNPNEAAELYLARLQQALKVPNSLALRMYQSFSREIKRIADLIHRYSDNEWYQDVLDETAFIELDFDDERIALSPTADPRLGSEMERIQKAQIVYTEAKTQPMPAIDYRQATYDYLEAIGVDDVEKLLPPPQNDQADQLTQLQMAYAQMDMRSQQMDAEARMLTAHSRMVEAQAKVAQVESEIEKTISETLKNLSDVESAKVQSALSVMRERFNALRGAMDVTDRRVEREENRIDAAADRIVAIRSGQQNANQSAQAGR